MKERLDIEINAAVRRTLVRHRIDMQKLITRATRGVVTLAGELVPDKSASGTFNFNQVLQVLDEIKNIDGIRRVIPNLSNFERASQPVNVHTFSPQKHRLPLSSSKRSVVAIDDESSMLDMLRDALSNQGYSVFTTTSADEAFLILEKEQISLVLLDVRMPKKSGFTFYREFIIQQQIPVLFVTGDRQSFSRDSEELVHIWKEHFTAGTTDIIYKPFTLKTLDEKVESLIGRSGAGTTCSVSDLEINRAVRRILIGHWIDLGRVSMHTDNGALWMSGEMGELSRAGTALDGFTTSGILSEMKSLPNLRDLNLELSNMPHSVPECRLTSLQG